MKTPPKFAVLIDGPWGIGKTHLIKNFLSDRKSDDLKSVYISLYGVEKRSDIDDAILEATYPIINNKAVRVTGRILKAFARNIKIDPDISSSDLLKIDSQNIYVFDDAERALMSIDVVFGYINEFIEHYDCKVIIVANSEILSKNVDYGFCKEKLIGHELLLDASFDDAFGNFLGEITHGATAHFLEQNRLKIATLFEQSSLKNFRILKQSLWAFERIFSAIPDLYSRHEEAMTELLSLVVPTLFELKSGRLTKVDINPRKSSLSSAVDRRNGRAESPFEVSDARYHSADLRSAILNDDTLMDICINGRISQTEIVECLKASRFFIQAQADEEWKIVWNYIRRPEHEVLSAIQAMEEKFKNRQYRIIGEMYHVFGLRLMLSSEGIINISKSNIALECRNYIDDVMDDEFIRKHAMEPLNNFNLQAYGGFGVTGIESTEMIEIYQYAETRRKEVRDQGYPEKGRAVVEMMKNDVSRFKNVIGFGYDDELDIQFVPILEFIESKIFVKTLLSLEQKDRAEILMSFRNRYNNRRIEKEFFTEQKWLELVRNCIRREQKKMGRVQKFQTDRLIEYFIDPYC